MRQLKKQNFHYVIVEIEVLKKLEHKNLVNFKDLYLKRRNGADILQVVMEFLNGGPLCNMIDQLEMHEKHIATIVHEVSEKRIGSNIKLVNLCFVRYCKAFTTCTRMTSFTEISSLTMF